ncbi:MAG: hypothetical protein WC865_15615 [Bacteroidales bacterium]
MKKPLNGHPDTKGWTDLFKEDLSNAEFTPKVWTSGKGVYRVAGEACRGEDILQEFED